MPRSPWRRESSWLAGSAVPRDDRVRALRYRASVGAAEGWLVFVVEEAPEGGYLARALGETIVTEADDLDQLRAMVRDAVLCHFDESDRPQVVRLSLVRDELLAV
ncbi:MAG: hypothetical protein ACYDH5_18080 [Acidimicrobiales bacterium]